MAVEKVLISTQHADGVEEKLPDALWEQVVTQVLPAGLYDPRSLRGEFYVNPTGRFVIGGPVGDAGLTGRKIIVDTYGGFARHGGGAFSGKDPSKVDRSAAYAARYVAKNIVAAGLADRAEVQVAYAIGVARPMSVLVETFGTEKIETAAIRDLVMANFDLRPAALLAHLDLRRPIYPRRPLTVISAVTSRTSPGSGPTRRPRCGTRPACRRGSPQLTPPPPRRLRRSPALPPPGGVRYCGLASAEGRSGEPNVDDPGRLWTSRRRRHLRRQPGRGPGPLFVVWPRKWRAYLGQPSLSPATCRWDSPH